MDTVDAVLPSDTGGGCASPGKALAAVLLVSSLAAPAHAAYNAMVDSKEPRRVAFLDHGIRRCHVQKDDARKDILQTIADQICCLENKIVLKCS